MYLAYIFTQINLSGHLLLKFTPSLGHREFINSFPNHADSFGPIEPIDEN